MVVDGQSVDVGKPHRLLTSPEETVKQFSAVWRERIGELLDEFHTVENGDVDEIADIELNEPDAEDEVGGEQADPPQGGVH
jgi:hypothetical protein